MQSYNDNSFERLSSYDHNFLVATTVSRMQFSSPSSMAAPQCTPQRWSTLSSASGPRKTLTTAWESECQTAKRHSGSSYNRLNSPCAASFSQQHLEPDEYLQLSWKQHHRKQLRWDSDPPQPDRSRDHSRIAATDLWHTGFPQSGQYDICIFQGC